MKKNENKYDFDLIVTQEQLKRNRKRELIKDKIRIANKIKIFFGILLITLFLIGFYLLDKTGNDYLEKCQEKGYSYNYCVEHM